MKYPAAVYAKTLTEMLTEAVSPSVREVATEKFYEFLKRSGDSAKVKDIIKITERLIREKNGETKVLIESPDEISSQTRQDIQKFFSGKVVFEEKIEENLKAGTRITINDEILIDASALLRLKGFAGQTGF